MKQIFLCLTIGWMCFVFYQGSRQLDESYSNSDFIVDGVMNLIETFQEIFQDKSEAIEMDQETLPESKNQVTMPNAENEKNEAKVVKEQSQQDISYIIRKSAHFFEYGLLAALLVIDFYLFKQSKLNIVIYSLFITLMCAVGDEFYQSFIGRGSSVRDVVIDFSGALFGIACVCFVLRAIEYLKSKSMKTT